MKQSFNFYHKIYILFFIPIFLTAMEENSIVLTAHTYNGNPFALLHQTFTDLKRYRSSEVETIDVDIKQLNEMEHLFADEAVLQCLQPEQVNQYKQAFPILFQLLKKSISYIAPATHPIFIPSDAQESLFNQVVVNYSSFNVSLWYKDYKNLVFHTFGLVDMHIKEQMYLCNELADMYSQDSIFICDSAKKRAFSGASHYDSIMATQDFLNDMYVEILTRLLILRQSIISKEIVRDCNLFLDAYCKNWHHESTYKVRRSYIDYGPIRAIDRIKKDLLSTEEHFYKTSDISATINILSKFYIELYVFKKESFAGNAWIKSFDNDDLNLQSTIQTIIHYNHENNKKEIDLLWHKDDTHEQMKDALSRQYYGCPVYQAAMNHFFNLPIAIIAQQPQFIQLGHGPVVPVQQQPEEELVAEEFIQVIENAIPAQPQPTNILNNVWSWLNSWQFKRK